MRRFENRLINILHKEVRDRLISFLKQLLQDTKNPKDIGDSKIRIPNYLTHEEIAHLIGTSRQTVTALFNDFRDSGVCIYSRREIIFSNVQKLIP